VGERTGGGGKEQGERKIGERKKTKTEGEREQVKRGRDGGRVGYACTSGKSKSKREKERKRGRCLPNTCAST
jgi:hypothetical protein